MRRRNGPVVAIVVAAAAMIVLLVSALGGIAAAGGGSQLRADREAYRPGDPAHLVAEVYKTDRDWFGPFTVRLRPYDPADDTIWYEPGSERVGDVVVGRLTVTRLDDRRVRAEVTFVMPKLTDGWWQVSYCNPGCTTTLGDLMASMLYVGTVPAAPVPTTAPVAPPTTTVRVTSIPTTVPAPASTTPVPSAAVEATTGLPPEVSAGEPRTIATGTATTSSEAWWWIAAGVALVVVVLGVAVLARRAGAARRSVSISAEPIVDAGEVVTIDLQPGPPSDEPIGAGR